MERKQILQFALAGLDRQRQDILAELGLLNSTPIRRRAKISAATRKRMAQAQKARWSKSRKAK